MEELAAWGHIAIDNESILVYMRVYFTVLPRVLFLHYICETVFRRSLAKAKVLRNISIVNLITASVFDSHRTYISQLFFKAVFDQSCNESLPYVSALNLAVLNYLFPY